MRVRLQGLAVCVFGCLAVWHVLSPGMCICVRVSMKLLEKQLSFLSTPAGCLRIGCPCWHGFLSSNGSRLVLQTCGASGAQRGGEKKNKKAKALEVK